MFVLYCTSVSWSSMSLYPLNRTGPIFYPSKNPPSALSTSLSFPLLIVFYPTIILSVKVPLYCPTPLLGGRTGDLTSIYSTTWAFDSHFPNRHLHHHHSLSTTAGNTAPSIESSTNAFIFFSSFCRHRPNVNLANPLLSPTNRS
jgi:hypothetical protein